MKTVVFIIGFFITLSGYSQLGMTSTYAITPVSITNPTIGAVYNSSYTVHCVVKNKGTAVYTGSVSLLRSIFSGTFQSTAKMVGNTSANLNPGDTLGFTFTDSITPGSFRPGNGNTVVVWPVGFIGTSDSLRTIPISVHDITGIHEFEKNTLIIYPNPVSQLLFIKPEPGVEYKEIKVYDLQMQLVMKRSFIENLDVSGLPMGIYTIIISTDKEKEYTTRFTKVD